MLISILLRSPLLVLAGALGCSGTGQADVAYPAFATGGVPAAIDADGWAVTLTEARVAFGPLTLCAAQSGSATLCETAIGEIADVLVVDATQPGPSSLGTVHGLSGDVRSASFDYGVHWFLTESEPTVDPRTPGGHSGRLAGRAVRGSDELDFVAEVDALPQYRGQRAVPSAPATASIDEAADVRLEIRFDPAAWIAEIDFDGLLDAGADASTIALGSPAHDALVIAMVATHPPTFTWSPTD